ncbi:MAG TPA: methylated-DNA--[protein]-cysteine S-methyltransferase [Candidatus Corynebacterium avicola]|uniref:Methylated-DNA--protein-cysteine methyltransferase n=1 Tax=Candidatus Corynebacterium avicola TaxID=2838527 RepID=A0A9D1RMS0_9CORY|nr:methylated-DNA--[protein]-cysteine S-methyltransferase [Candidatus Corynebacterium avicola]
MSELTDRLPFPDSELDRLTGRLAESAAQENLLDVSYRTVDSPIGPLFLATTDTGLVRVAFENEDTDAVLTELSERIGPRIIENPKPLDAVARELDEYFAGTRHDFDLPLDFSMSASASAQASKGTPPFRQIVQQYLPSIDYGSTRSYKEVAEAVGNTKAVRAVGTACATNPIPVVVPCHRVLRTDGKLGGYRGGLEAKKVLLELERSAPTAA